MNQQPPVKPDYGDSVQAQKNDGSTPGRENFVSKLYQMLETPEFAGIVAWNETDQGPSFVILDTSKFQEQILVSEFNHANFSSFVRQLNKYDFHKVKFRDPYSRVWEFRHPLFRPENREKAYLIKRKQQSTTRRGKRSDSTVAKDQAAVAAKAAELAAKDTEGTLKGQYSDLESRLHRLERNYTEILSAFRLQQRLVERLCHEVDLPDIDDAMEEEALDNSRGVTPSNGISPSVELQQQQPVVNMYPMQQQQQQQQQHPQLYNSTQQQHPHQQPGVRSDNYYIQSPTIPTSPATASPFTTTGSSALVAVDDHKVRDILIKILMKFGLTVDSVDNGVDVVRRVESNKYDYILIDSILKSLDGLSAVLLIRQMNVFTPILLLSDTLSPEEESDSLQRGVSSVLYRPFTQEDLFNALRRFTPTM